MILTAGPQPPAPRERPLGRRGVGAMIVPVPATASPLSTAHGRWRAAVPAGVALLVVVCSLIGASAPSLADTTTVSSTQGSFRLTASPSPQAGKSLTITESGQTGVTSTLQVFAQLGQPCSLDQGQEVAIGALHLDQRVIPAASTPFSVTTAFTPAAAGTFYICGYLDGASAGTEEDQAASIVVVVAPAPPPPSPPPATASPAPATPAATATRPCVVPALARHTLAGAKHLLAVAGCSLGVILQPSARGLARARRAPGGKSLVLLVASQFPAPGTQLRANQYVAIRLVLGRPR
jgi:hypothetical protein